jgi:predicted RNA-binding Zn-ribbon protein involved in translation (DUF1610 family)
MYAANLHTARHELSVDAHFVCASCGWESPVRITVAGSGQGVAHYGIGNQAAHEAARSHAVASAQKAARMVWEVLTCPRCGVKSKNDARTRTLWIVLPVTIVSVSLALAIVGASVLAFFGAKLGAAGGVLAVATMVAIPMLLPSVLFVLLRTIPTVRLRRNADKHAQFPVATR